MLEETAGIYYKLMINRHIIIQQKKADCVQLMQKKEDKIKEINELINLEITP